MDVKNKFLSGHSNRRVRGSETYTQPHRNLRERQKKKSFDCVLIMVKMCFNEPKTNLYDV